MALIEIMEEIFSSRLNAELTLVVESSMVASREMTTYPKDKVVVISKTNFSNKKNQNLIILWVWFYEVNAAN